ncbi:MAG TPA: serine protease [Pyrinomonadaceae bacterium]|jgi:S1-C subfamily serine protease
MKFARKIFFGLLCASLLAACTNIVKNETPLAAAPDKSVVNQNKKERIDALNNSVFCISVRVKGKDFNGKYSVGTAFLIGGGLLASALHVQTKAGELAGEFNKGTSQIVAWKTLPSGDYVEFPIELFVSDKNSDLAIYRFDDADIKTNPKFSGIKPLMLAENLPPIGEEVVAIGYYGDYQFPFNSIGNVSMIDKNEDIFSDITIMPGNSGAPVCSLETGEVLGITVSVLDLGNETVRFGIAKRAAKMRELLQKLEKKN